jgi:hypothetical protein
MQAAAATYPATLAIGSDADDDLLRRSTVMPLQLLPLLMLRWPSLPRIHPSNRD